jgi:ubiquinone/menaquinone biosynthesis C-methylase UbiE
MAQPESVVYTHGHHESVLRSHNWRTALNSAAYLIPHLKPHMKVLDVGCGPATITADFAELVPQGSVIGIENAPGILKQAQDTIEKRGLKNVTFQVADVHKLPFEDGTFDVTHSHQVLQHVGDPVQALREMKRVTKPGGIVAARDADFGAMTWYPEVDGMEDWRALYLRVARSNGGEPNAGRRLHAWAHEAGFERKQITKSVGTWLYTTPEERAWWSELWADRTVASSFADTAIKNGVADKAALDSAAKAWRSWGNSEDAWYVIVNAEIICHV